MIGLGKIKKEKKKKQKKAKSSGGLLKNLFGKNKEKNEKKKTAKKQKKTDKAMAKKQKKADKQQAKMAKKTAKQQNKADKKQAKVDSKVAKQTAKVEKKQIKAENKATKQANKQQRNFDLENALTTATMVKDAVAQNVPAAGKYLNVNKENDEEYMDNEVNSSGELNTASAKNDEGFFSKHKAILIGGGIVLTALLGAALIIKSRKSSTPSPAVSGVTLRAIDLS